MEQQHTHEQHHPGKPTYNLIFAILAVITVVEVLWSEVHAPALLHYGLLLGLLSLKGGLVVAYYMHLKFEPPLLTWIFVVPLIMGVAVVLSLQGLAGY